MRGRSCKCQLCGRVQSSSRSCCWLSLNDFVSFFAFPSCAVAWLSVLFLYSSQDFPPAVFRFQVCGGDQSYRVLPVWHLQTATDWERVIKIKAIKSNKKYICIWYNKKNKRRLRKIHTPENKSPRRRSSRSASNS